MNKINILAWTTNIILITISLAPIADKVPQPLERSDLIYHGIAYAGTAFLFLKAYQKKPIMISLGLIIQGVGIEFLQPQFGRHFESLDMVANGLGVILGLVLFKVLNYFLLKEQQDL